MRVGRRRFLQAMFGAACGMALGDEVLDVLDRLAPRPVMVPGADLTGPFCSVTTNADINRIWRKVQGDLMDAMRLATTDWANLSRGQIVAVDYSARFFTVDWQ